MTNSFKSSQNLPLKLLLIPGLNNDPAAFHPMRDELEKLGFRVELINIPCHGEDRYEASTLQQAITCFEKTLAPHMNGEYVVVAFSQGALYFQLWLEQKKYHPPLAQVLLAPALKIQRQSLAMAVFASLPPFFHIKSFAPKKFRRYQTLRVNEYRLLMEGMRAFSKIEKPFPCRSMVIIDPKDELVDVPDLELRSKTILFRLWERPYLKKGLGQHHILFHPEYFNELDWKNFLSVIAENLRN